MARAGPVNCSSLSLAQPFIQEFGMQLKLDRVLWGFLLENQEKGALFTGTDCRDKGSLQLLGAIRTATQEGSHPGDPDTATQSPKMEKKRWTLEGII